jgi:hypothetical protein
MDVMAELSGRHHRVGERTLSPLVKELSPRLKALQWTIEECVILFRYSLDHPLHRLSQVAKSTNYHHRI